jgi:predicted oxidoreductase
MTVPTINLSSGPTISRLVLGAWRFNDGHLPPSDIPGLIHTCLEVGITTVDHADIYGGYSCERLFGAAVGPALRDRLQIVTKCGIKLVSSNRPAHQIKQYDTSHAHIVASVENSLKELRTDRLDVLLIHRPDPLMDADDVARAFADLKAAGKVLHFGVSNFTVGQFDLLASRLPLPLVTNQLEFSVMQRTPMYDGTFDQCQRLRISPMAWSPLGGGKLFVDQGAAGQRAREALERVGHDLGGATIDQIALAWILAHPSRPVPILGTTNPQRVRSAAAAEALKLSREQWFTVLKAAAGADVP